MRYNNHFFASGIFYRLDGRIIMDTFNNLVITMSTCFALIGSTVGILLALKEYKLKLKAETRLSKSANAETDIQLVKVFTDIMNLANGRSGYCISEKVIEKILELENLSEISLHDGSLHMLISKNAIIKFPVGSAQQDAAISAICVLAKRHEFLKPIAIQALESIYPSNPEIAERYLSDLKKAT